MKKLLLITILAAIFYSCKKDNDANKDTEVTIVGKWTYLKDSLNFYNDNGSFKNNHVEDYTGEGLFLQFNSNGTGSDNGHSFTYKLTGKTLDIHQAAYVQDDIEYPEDDYSVTVLELSKNKLYLFHDYKETGKNTLYATLAR